MISVDDPSDRSIEAFGLRLAANAAVWELQTAVEVVHLLAEQKFKISRQDAYPLIHTMDEIEAFFAPAMMPPTGATAFLNDAARQLHDGILHLHLVVTGESADYQIH